MLLHMRLDELGDGRLHVRGHGEKDGRLEDALVDEQVFEMVVEQGGLDAAEIALEDHGVLIFRAIRLFHVRGASQVGFGIFAEGFEQVSGHLIQFRGVGHDQRVGDGRLVEELSQLALRFL